MRLSVRNLPIDFTEKKLKEMCRNNSSNHSSSRKATGHARIVQVKIVRSADRTDKNGLARSKRFGFVEFEKHQDALVCLRQLNNNPDVFTKGSRPIVEFALDDMRKLMILRKNQLRSIRQAQAKIDEDDDVAVALVLPPPILGSFFGSFNFCAASLAFAIAA